MSPQDPELERLAREIEARRPVPHPAFRGEVRRRLLASRGVARRRARALVAAYAGSGVLLIGIAAIGLAGAGPFGPG